MLNLKTAFEYKPKNSAINYCILFISKKFIMGDEIANIKKARPQARRDKVFILSNA